MTDETNWQVRRDFVGYGRDTPDPRWPGGARVAVNFVLNVEEGSEASVQDGEGYTENNLTEAAARAQIPRGRDLAAEGMFEYGSRAGFWRILRLFEERKLPLTFFACALALERNPQQADAIRASGMDICSHGWRWLKHFEMDEAEERAQIARAVKSFQTTTGLTPEGWYCRYGPSLNTRRLLADHGGFLYDSDYYGDELPFWTTVQGSPHLIVPYTLTTNDTRHLGANGTSDDWFAFCRDHFDMLYEEGSKGRPAMMSIGLHSRITGHPARAVGLRKLLDHMAAHEGAWITRRIDIARHWVATHPFPGKGLNE
jgi:peptidoglycan/xylan/chitin deacetylase (PgdA/CDA1 family)